MKKFIKEFQDYQATQGMAKRTVAGYKYTLTFFTDFLAKKEIEDIKDVDRAVIHEYQEYLFHVYVTKEGKKLALPYQANLLNVLKPFAKFLMIKDYILYDPTVSLKLPKLPKKLPRDIMTIQEVKNILSLPDLTTALGSRDKCLLEILYSTGIRADEARKIELQDIDLSNRELTIRDGKGGKDAVLPLTKKCTKYIEKYLDYNRGLLLDGNHFDALLIGERGKPFNKETVSKIVRQYVKESKIKKNITTHSFRHTIATHLLKKGVSIRLIQELLRHESLDTTERYTKVDITDLRNALDHFHPRGKM